jgi:O-antigen ligase
LCGTPLLLVLALSGSRSVWIYLVALLVVSFWLHRRDAGASGRRALLCAVALLAGFALANWVVTLPMFITERVSVSTTLQRLFDSLPGSSARLQLWREAWWMFTDSPVFGGGFGQFAWQRFEFLNLFPGAELGAALQPLS